LLRDTWSATKIVELEGPKRISPNEIAATFAEILGRPVTAEAVPRDAWEGIFKSQGMNNPTPRIQMLDGLNQGWIDFERGEAGLQKGRSLLKDVLRELVKSQQPT